jgi:hypothetical protein
MHAGHSAVKVDARVLDYDYFLSVRHPRVLCEQNNKRVGDKT